MSRLSPQVRPILRHENSSSSSLNGMEIAASKPLLRNSKSRDSDDYQNAKPLPPTPTLKVPSITSSRASSIVSSRVPSTGSLSTANTEDMPLTPKYVPFKRETILPSPKTAYEPPKYRSSTSVVPDVPSSRPKPRRDAKTRDVLQRPFTLKARLPESVFSEWKAPKYDGQDDGEEPRIAVPVKILAQKSRVTRHIAEQHADEYRHILPRVSMLPSFEPEAEPYYDGLNSLPAPMSPRIIDVVDETLVPRPLRMSTAFDSNTSSHFSSSSDDLAALKEGTSESLKARAKKAFHPRKHSQERWAKRKSGRDTSSKLRSTEERKQVMSMTPSERASIQKGIIDMYDSLTNLYDPFNKYSPPAKLIPASQPKSTIELYSPNKNLLRKDHRSLAAPQRSRQKSVDGWGETTDITLPSPRTKSARGSWFTDSLTGNTPNRSHFSPSSKATSSSDGNRSSFSSAERKKMKSYTFPRRSHNSKTKVAAGGGWRKAVGFERNKAKKTEGEKRREEMKKKIVVVRTVT